jgi:hypothetical protein
MKGKIISGITPQQKMVAVNNRFGNTNIAQQQGSTRVLYDSEVLVTGKTEYRFFENAGTKNYPFTNIGSEGNRLNVGETFTVQKIYFAYAVTDPDTGAITSLVPGLGVGSVWKGEFNLQIANSQVIKQLPMSMFAFTQINPTSVSNQDLAFETFTDIVIPPLLEYVVSCRTVPTDTVPTNGFRIFCFLEGTAGIIAPQTTF